MVNEKCNVHHIYEINTLLMCFSVKCSITALKPVTVLVRFTIQEVTVSVSLLSITDSLGFPYFLLPVLPES